MHRLRYNALMERVPLGFGNLYASIGDHIGHFYETGEEGQEVLIAFLRAGLQGRDKCVCLVAPGDGRKKLLEELQAAGIDVESAVASGQLFVDAGSSDPEELRRILSDALASIPDRFSLLRWAGVMSWALDKMPTAERLMEWETHCNTIENPAAVFLCQYELSSFRGNVVMDALKTHPISVVGSAVHQNPYFQDPEAFLQELRRRRSTTMT